MDAPPAHAHKIIVDDQVIEVPAPPPPERVEVIPARPSETVAWRPGYWRWEHDEWVWIAGHYVERPHPEAVWIPGHWIYHSWGSAWVPGHWG
jgi:hypothetical protein